MIRSSRVAFALVTLSSAIAVFSLLTKKPLPKKKKPSLQCHIEKNPSFSCAAAEKKDIISQLPDDILISIIAHMPVKCAVSTSVLSKRWRNLHRCVSDIAFDCRYLLGHQIDPYKLHESNLIIESVNRFLWLRSGSKIHSFRLSCCFYKLSIYQFNHCIYSLGRLGVEKLFLRCGCYLGSSDFSFSLDLLSEIPSLKYFELSLCSLPPSLTKQCNSLQDLCLSYVNVCPGAIECILSKCSRLISFRMGNCKSPPNLCFRGPHLQLKYLYINDCEGVKEIEFYASNLVSFEFANPELVKFIFDHVPQLQSIYLNVFKENIVPYVGGKLALDLPRLKSLTFVSRGDYFQGSIGYMGTNIFRNLRRLDLSLYNIPQMDLLLLTQLLQSCSLVQEFHLNTNFLEYNAPQEKKRAILFHSELKEMEISGFVGTENEIEFALYILKSAISLEKMQINRCCKIYEGSNRWRRRYETPWSEDERNSIHMKLQGQAVSKTAQVFIQHKPRFED
ncbi:hypothetical protein ABFS82_03G113500 [Erythranthe guttata]|uniref:F-box/FBD/LRR-repeat protein At1g13570-like isoform X1 n=1 Tax=Erythranthe guttata TaxID=4155 RepID=UPI00064DFB93|nr:PREDICTED: F-box/FBD/LRR-repeat protein At1g13570-like isoform X1 [Erythranthe guttata]|eukprot:XP_012854754.1 PREDICTED: F-box/FBD/LRR-repeat protein At1g13570-like isoform X1 [Erythranthe guttata]